MVIESLYHGCPVVAFDVNYGPSELIEHGETGFIVPFGNEELLAERIITLLNNHVLYKRMYASARRSAQRVASDGVAQKWALLIRDVMVPQPQRQVTPTYRAISANVPHRRDTNGP